MSAGPILIVGAGPAGLAAAVTLARAGLASLVVDRAPAAGGAIHRQPLPGRRSVAATAERRRWAALSAAVTAAGPAITLRPGTRFGGLDHNGAALLCGASPEILHPRALILATGAREAVQPRPGWTLPGVMTAGAVQVMLKTAGEAPGGRILLAGSGPLLLAVAAQLCALGRPPVAVVEAGRPFARPLAALGLPAPYLAEAARHLVRLLAARVPLLTGAHVAGIERAATGLTVAIETGAGRREIGCDLLGLHDGIRANDTGLPEAAPIPVLRVGDCREPLGGRAALADGRRGGARLAALLDGRPEPPADPALARERRAQARLAALYAHDGRARLADLPGETVICRCEGRTLDDLRALGPAPSDRQLRLDGRFAMGACQGRFCTEWVQALAGRTGAAPRLGAARFPAGPVPVADLIAAHRPPEGDLP